MGSEIYHDAISAAFGVMQGVMFAVVAAAFKTYFDVRKHGKDLRAAFKKIRALECELREHTAHLEE